MASMRKIIIIAMFVLNSVFISISASAQQRTFSEELTEVFGKVWPYEAFLAIPKIGEIAPRLIIPVDSVGKIKEGARCAEVDDLDLLRELNPKAILPRENLYRLSCRTLLMSLSKIKDIPIPRHGFSDESILVLKFYFGTGKVQVLTY